MEWGDTFFARLDNPQAGPATVEVDMQEPVAVVVTKKTADETPAVESVGSFATREDFSQFLDTVASNTGGTRSGDEVFLPGGATLSYTAEGLTSDLEKVNSPSVAVFKTNEFGEAHYQGLYKSREDFADRAQYASHESMLDRGSEKYGETIRVQELEQHGYRVVSLKSL